MRTKNLNWFGYMTKESCVIRGRSCIFTAEGDERVTLFTLRNPDLVLVSYTKQIVGLGIVSN